MQGRVVRPLSDLRGDEKLAVELLRPRIALEGDVRLEDVPPRVCRKELHPVERTPPQHHRLRAGADVVRELQRGCASARPVDAPRVADAVRAAEREVSVRALVVAPDPLVDVARTRRRRRHRMERRVRLVHEDASVVRVGRGDRRVLVVGVGRIRGVAFEQSHADVRRVGGVDRLAGEPRLDRRDVRDALPQEHAPLEHAVRDAQVLAVERLSPVALDRYRIDAGNLGGEVGVVRREAHHHRRVALPGLRRVRVGDRASDARRVREFHRHVLDRLRHARHVCAGIAAVHVQHGRLAVPAFRKRYVDSVRVHLVHVPEVHHGIVDLVRRWAR